MQWKTEKETVKVNLLIALVASDIVFRLLLVQALVEKYTNGIYVIVLALTIDLENRIFIICSAKNDSNVFSIFHKIKTFFRCTNQNG